MLGLREAGDDSGGPLFKFAYLNVAFRRNEWRERILAARIVRDRVDTGAETNERRNLMTLAFGERARRP